MTSSLRSGTPMLSVLPHKLADRLFYHGTLATLGSALSEDDQLAEQTFEENLQHMQTLDTMYFATAMVAVFQTGANETPTLAQCTTQHRRPARPARAPAWSDRSASSRGGTGGGCRRGS